LENIVFKEREACVCNIQFSGDVEKLAEIIDELKQNENIIDVSI
jgi:hypothetical protein